MNYLIWFLFLQPNVFLHFLLNVLVFEQYEHFVFLFHRNIVDLENHLLLQAILKHIVPVYIHDQALLPFHYIE